MQVDCSSGRQRKWVDLGKGERKISAWYRAVEFKALKLCLCVRNIHSTSHDATYLETYLIFAVGFQPILDAAHAAFMRDPLSSEATGVYSRTARNG